MPDLAELFGTTVDPLELVVRGTAIYVGLVLMFRFALQRDLAGLGVADVLFIALIADAAQNGMAGEYRSIGDAAVLLGTLAFWNVAMNLAIYRWPRVRRLLEHRPMPLVRDGRIVRRNLRREWITVDELRAQLRAKGIEDVSDVKLAVLESDGEMSVLVKDGRQPTEAKGGGGPRKRNRGGR